MSRNVFKKIVDLRKAGHAVGIFSVCSINEYVLRAALSLAKKDNTYLVIEATANQVNQYGGYSQMTPQDFKEYVKKLAQEYSLDMEKIILGGDHLGPLVWKNEEDAMRKAYKLVKEYARSGYTKIHIDTSMELCGDKELSTKVIAERGARLCRAAEEGYRVLLQEDPQAEHPVYVIGSEVPVPGGKVGTETEIEITQPESCLQTIMEYKEAFEQEGLQDAFQYIVALVVQPGVEFDNENVYEYSSGKAKKLMSVDLGSMVFEGHSTDYQPKEKLINMVADGVAILKVGPALTYAMREALFSLEQIEKELYNKGILFCKSGFSKKLLQHMLKDDKYWRGHFSGTRQEVAFNIKYGLSDRSRYYMMEEDVQEAVQTMLTNLADTKIPITLLSQFMPLQYQAVITKKIRNRPEDLINDRIQCVLKDYQKATNIYMISETSPT